MENVAVSVGRNSVILRAVLAAPKEKSVFPALILEINPRREPRVKKDSRRRTSPSCSGARREEVVSRPRERIYIGTDGLPAGGARDGSRYHSLARAPKGDHGSQEPGGSPAPPSLRGWQIECFVRGGYGKQAAASSTAFIAEARQKDSSNCRRQR